MRFRTGQKVICVDDKPRNSPSVPLNKDQAYTVVRHTHEGAGVLLVEIASPWNADGSFWSDRFRPAVERKTDISIFTKLLTPTRKEVALSSTNKTGD